MKDIFNHLIWLFKGVQVYALIGKSGTGKSFRAQLIAQKYNIEFIIDDGLLIKGNKILSGKSAKKETLYLTAVKTALFHEPGHVLEVREVLETEHFKRILILGTSLGMVEKITQRLGLPLPYKILKIEDIASKTELAQAEHARQVEGKHVIPVPSMEIKRNYPHIFYDSVKIFFQKGLGLFDKSRIFEKTVVRPEFSKRGKVSISEAALQQMIIHCVDEFDSAITVKKISIKSDSSSYRLVLQVDIPFGFQVSGTIHSMQSYIIENIEKFTGILLDEVNIIINSIKREN